jgi:phosphatidylglycerophosphate synthase
VAAADWLSAARLLLVPLIWPLALAGQARLVGLGLVVAGVTDVLDGYLARRSDQPSAHGARLDAVADILMMVSVAVWLQILFPEILHNNVALLGITAGVYVASMAVSLTTFHRFVDPRQLSSKIAGAMLYGFALVTLITGVYTTVLLVLAALLLIAASLETIARAATATIQARGRASRQRSHKPQASNEVGSMASPRTSTASSAAPMNTDARS